MQRPARPAAKGLSCSFTGLLPAGVSAMFLSLFDVNLCACSPLYNHLFGALSRSKTKIFWDSCPWAGREQCGANVRACPVLNIDVQGRCKVGYSQQARRGSPDRRPTRPGICPASLHCWAAVKASERATTLFGVGENLMLGGGWDYHERGKWTTLSWGQLRGCERHLGDVLGRGETRSEGVGLAPFVKLGQVLTVNALDGGSNRRQLIHLGIASDDTGRSLLRLVTAECSLGTRCVGPSLSTQGKRGNRRTTLPGAADWRKRRATRLYAAPEGVDSFTQH